MGKRGFVYIMTNRKDGTLYIGVTSNLIKRVYQHKTNLVEGFTYKYNLKRLVYYEIFETIEEAIKREKQLKNWKRECKITLIESINPQWLDLYDDIAAI
ncbi:MAG: GIY-YIG nuclease family protein [Spirochaetota bacterium]